MNPLDRLGRRLVRAFTAGRFDFDDEAFHEYVDKMGNDLRKQQKEKP